MSRGDNDEMVGDTIFTLEQFLSDITMMEITESYIAKELEQIKQNFGEEGSEGFYGGMVFDSTARAQKLLRYRNRTQSIIDRLSAFTKKGKRKYHVVEGGMAEYD